MHWHLCCLRPRGYAKHSIILVHNYNFLCQRRTEPYRSALGGAALHRRFHRQGTMCLLGPRVQGTIVVLIMYVSAKREE